MTAKEFFDTVVSMRENQKKYFATRDTLALRESKRLEKIIDEEITRVTGIVQKPTNETNLPTLFDGHET